MTLPKAVAEELDRNSNAYSALKEEMETNHWGKIILLSGGEVVGIYNDKGDAYSIGCEKYKLGGFSLQRVGEQPIDLGFHSIALNAEL